MRLREAQPGDRDTLRRMLAQYLFEFDGRTVPYPSFDEYWEGSERQPFLIEVDGELVGLCLVRRRDGGWSIAEFAIVSDRRGGGVGRAAVDALADRARSDGAAYLEAKVHRGNPEALMFWRAIGFREVDRPGVGVTVTRRRLKTS